MGETLGRRLGETLGRRLGETLGRRLGETLDRRLGEGEGKTLNMRSHETSASLFNFSCLFKIFLSVSVLIRFLFKPGQDDGFIKSVTGGFSV